MSKLWEILLDSLKDTALLLPLLLVVYFLIEYLEYRKVLDFEKSKLLKGNASPVIGALFGSVPQCGFSVISAELYAERKISIAALISVFIATSDEALPIMIANYRTIPAMLALMLTKVLIAIIVGYISLFLYKKLFKAASKPANTLAGKPTSAAEGATQHENEHEHDNEHKHEHEHIHACCHHDIEDNHKFNWKHPLIHCLKIFAYLFVVGALIEGLVELIGPEKISAFLTSSKAFQPLFALVVGLIPNCAASVILTGLYIDGLLSFGSIVTGLCVNAGIGIFVLLKENKNFKENLFIFLTLIISSLVFGYSLHFLPLDFLII